MKHGLTTAATRVVKACDAIPWGAKGVWLEDWNLDGPEGSYIRPEGLAERIGLTAATVERYRKYLLSLGLYRRIPRTGSKNGAGWRPILPERFVPSSERPDPTEITRLALALGVVVRERAPGKEGPKSLDSGNRLPDSRERAPALGGVGGGAPTSASQGEATLHPAYIKEKDGVSPYGQKSKDGDEPQGVLPQNTEPSSPAQNGLVVNPEELVPRPIDQRPASEVTEEGFARLREQRRLATEEAQRKWEQRRVKPGVEASA